jgi:GNAT superfamily N-acetyltransferase
MAPLVRDAGIADAQVVVALIRELGEMDGDYAGLDVEDVKQFLDIPANTILLAEEGDQVLGLLSYTVSFDLWHAGNCCLIRELIIHSGSRQKGLGGLLLEEVFRRAERDGWIEVSVSTGLNNSPAIAFYKKHGMTDEAVLLERHFLAD